MNRLLQLLSVAALVTCFAADTVAITIQFDYSLDGPAPFFDTPEKRDALEAAADVYEQLINDRLLAIEPSDDNWWRVHIPNPGTGGGSAFDVVTGVNEDVARSVRVGLGPHAVAEGDVVDVPRHVREQGGNHFA